MTRIFAKTFALLLTAFLVLTTAAQGQKMNLGLGTNLGYRSSYDNVGLTGCLQILSSADIFGVFNFSFWSTGVKFTLTKKKFKPVLGLSYCHRNSENHEFGTENNYTFYKSDPIDYIVPEIGCKKRVYTDDESTHFIEFTLCLNYRISNQLNKVYYISGNPIKQSSIDKMNFEIADGLGINMSIIYYFFKHKNN